MLGKSGKGEEKGSKYGFKLITPIYMSSYLAVALMEGALEYLAGLLLAADEAREVLLAEEGGGSEARGDLAVSIMLPPGRRYY